MKRLSKHSDLILFYMESGDEETASMEALVEELASHYDEEEEAYDGMDVYEIIDLWMEINPEIIDFQIF